MRIPISILLSFLFFSCSQKDLADTLIINADLLLPESSNAEVSSALAIRDGKILAIGNSSLINIHKGPDTEIIDAKGQFLMPGFIEGHGHFSGLGRMLNGLNFLQDTSWNSILEKIKAKVAKTPKGNWIEGRGWHQEKWKIPFSPQVSGYPTSEGLDSIAPDHPVILFHASGHGLFANKAAMDIAGIDNEFPNPIGGNIVRGPFGEAIGVFEENAQQLIRDHYKTYQSQMSDQEIKDRWLTWIKSAEEESLSKGITSFQDAGSSFQDIKWYKELAEKKELNLRLWVMLRHSYDEMINRMDGLPISNFGEDFLCMVAESL